MKKILTAFFVLLLLASCTTTPGISSTDTATTPTPKIIIPTPPSCKDIVAAPTPGPEVPSVFPPVSNTDRVRGSADPTLTVMAYSDYQDPRSALFAEVMDELLDENPGEVQVVSRIFPLVAVNDKAAIAAQGPKPQRNRGNSGNSMICFISSKRIGSVYQLRISNSGSARKVRRWE
jgi:hypothetical protein